jgi:hypothetical protein
LYILRGVYKGRNLNNKLGEILNGLTVGERLELSFRGRTTKLSAFKAGALPINAIPPLSVALMGLGSIELPTFRLAARRSIRLSYRPIARRFFHSAGFRELTSELKPAKNQAGINLVPISLGPARVAKSIGCPRTTSYPFVFMASTAENGIGCGFKKHCGYTGKVIPSP